MTLLLGDGLSTIELLSFIAEKADVLVHLVDDVRLRLHGRLEAGVPRERPRRERQRAAAPVADGAVLVPKGNDLGPTKAARRERHVQPSFGKGADDGPAQIIQAVRR